MTTVRYGLGRDQSRKGSSLVRLLTPSLECISFSAKWGGSLPSYTYTFPTKQPSSAFTQETHRFCSHYSTLAHIQFDTPSYTSIHKEKPRTKKQFDFGSTFQEAA